MVLRSALVLMCLWPALTACGQSSKGGRYPRVYGWTGRPYGPTQAHYQYQRQYGRNWHGYGGNSLGSAARVAPYANGYPLGGGGYVYAPPVAYLYPNYAIPSYGWPVNRWYGYSSRWYGYSSLSYGAQFPWYANASIPAAPPAVWGPPALPQNAALLQAAAENEQRWRNPVDLAAEQKPRPAIIPSTPEARLRSLEARQRGDQWFRQQDFTHAYARYKSAIASASDQAIPHFRLAFTLVALGRHSRAVDYLKLGLLRDPAWPHTGQPLEQLYRQENTLVQTSHLHKVAEWVRADIRDPDRLFLLGVMLHFTEQPDKAATCFETALRLSGRGEHLKVFLRSAAKAQAPNPAAAPAGPADAGIPQAPGQPGLGLPPAPAVQQPPAGLNPVEARPRQPFRLNSPVAP